VFTKAITLVTGPSVEPVSLDEATRFCRVDDPAENPLIEMMIAAARESVEQATERALISQQLLLNLSTWAAGYRGTDRSGQLLPYGTTTQTASTLLALYPSLQRANECLIFLERSPLISIDSVQYYDTNEVLKTLTAWDSNSNPTGIYYPAFKNAEPGCLALRADSTFPDVYARPDAIQIKFTAGYGIAPSSVPKNLKNAVLLLTKHLYDNRDVIVVGSGSAIEIPHGIKNILDSRKVGGWVV
jgi:uncharacterized phiE125 gp8 family phage protein